MNEPAPRFGRYDWSGGREASWSFGPDRGTVAIVALPLFEEANRTRTFTVSILGALAARGVASLLPDLPGQGESQVPLETVSLLDLRDAYAAAVDAVGRGGRRCFGIAIRSGALIDAVGVLDGRWHLAPQTGPALVRELTRIKQAEIGTGRRLVGAWYDGDEPVEIAGNMIAPALLRDLAVSPIDEPSGLDRTVRFDGDTGIADRRLPGPALWRRTEPGNDLVIAQRLADDIADWIATCEG